MIEVVMTVDVMDRESDAVARCANDLGNALVSGLHSVCRSVHFPVDIDDLPTGLSPAALREWDDDA